MRGRDSIGRGPGIVSGLMKAKTYTAKDMAERGPLCSITIHIYPDGGANQPVDGAVAFRHKSIEGRCLRSCPFYRQGTYQIYEWISEVDPMTFPPVETREE